MTRRFVVGVSGMSKMQQTAFIEYLRSTRVAWWHWIDDMWLVVDRSGDLHVRKIRDKLRDISGPRRSLVIEVRHLGSWAGFGPSADDKNMFEWIRSTWKRPDDNGHQD